jgi:hypothetical protein
MKKLVFLLMGVFVFFSLQDVTSAQTRFTAALNTAQEVPAPTVTTTPTGTAVLTLTGDAMSGFTLKYDITVTNLSGSITNAHFHRALPGVAAGTVKGILSSFKGNTATGTWGSSDMSEPLTAELVQALINGELYINVHTATNRGGEIRGQVYPTLTFIARLDSTQEVPTPTVMGTPTGTAVITLRGISTGQVEVSYQITVDGLSGPITAAHFHQGAPGMMGDIVKTITTEFQNNTASGVWRSGVMDQPLSPDRLRALLNGEIYINVHTDANRSGEIRGQVIRDQ